jgi:hypothetical protein
MGLENYDIREWLRDKYSFSKLWDMIPSYIKISYELNFNDVDTCQLVDIIFNEELYDYEKFKIYVEISEDFKKYPYESRGVSQKDFL